MSLTTFSVFYFDYEVTKSNRFLSFSEGGPEIIAEIAVGSYSFSDIADAVATALNNAGALVYTVTANRSTRTFTISATGNFELLVSTGTTLESIFPTIGFTGSDRTGSASYTGGEAGKAYEPQFILQDHVPSTNSQKSVDAAVRKTADGRIEVIKFGIEKFVKFNIKYATNISQDSRVIKNNPTGVEDLQEFMQFITTKAPIEFMPNAANKNVFEKILLESTPFDRDGVGYELQELFNQNLPGFFETGQLTFRVVT